MIRQELIDKLMEWRAEELVKRYLNTYTDEIKPNGNKKSRHEYILEETFKELNDMTYSQLRELYMLHLIERVKRD